MTWSLQASGHTPTPGGFEDLPQPWADVEQRLYDELRAVLSKPEYGCSAAQFTGNYVTGQPYDAPVIDPVIPPALTIEEEAQLAALEAKRAAWQGGPV
jgi:hypothetical protein